MVDIDETTVLLAVFVILLVPFPLISYGTTEGIESLWWLGLALLVLGGVVPPLTRYVLEDGEDEDEEDEEDEAADEGETDRDEARGAADDEADGAGGPDEGASDGADDRSDGGNRDAGGDGR